MCTAFSLSAKSGHFFGRTLDLEFSYDECVCIMPRNYKLTFSNLQETEHHFAVIGMATVLDGYPLYYDGTNEKGLSVAALRFPEAKEYNFHKEGYINLASFEIIPYILSGFETAKEAAAFLKNLNITNEGFSAELPPTPLHFLISDSESSFVLEQTDVLRIYENPACVLSNSPEFSYQLFNLNNYLSLSAKNKENTFSKDLKLQPYSHGMGAVGLPGDNSSVSRFVRCAFLKSCARLSDKCEENINCFFHILDSVCQIKGSNITDDEKCVITVYSSCCDTKNLEYYYKTYENPTINKVCLLNEDLSGKSLISYPLILREEIKVQN